MNSTRTQRLHLVGSSLFAALALFILGNAVYPPREHAQSASMLTAQVSMPGFGFPNSSSIPTGDDPGSGHGNSMWSQSSATMNAFSSSSVPTNATMPSSWSSYPTTYSSSSYATYSSSSYAGNTFSASSTFFPTSINNVFSSSTSSSSSKTSSSKSSSSSSARTAATSRSSSSPMTNIGTSSSSVRSAATSSSSSFRGGEQPGTSSSSRTSSSSSRSSEPTVIPAGDTLGCFDVNGRWTTDREMCAKSERQAEILGFPEKENEISDEDFRREGNELFTDDTEQERRAKVATVRDVLARSIERIDVLLNDPSGTGINPELALVTRDWLTRQEQTLTTDSVEEVAENIRVSFGEVRDSSFFERLDKVRTGIRTGFTVFAREKMDLPLEDLFEFQRLSSLLDAPSCRAEGTSCPAVAEFLSLVEGIRERMETAARTNNKTFVLKEIEESMR